MRTDELHASAVLYSRLREELATAYGLEADDEFLTGSLEGASDLNEIIIRALREAREAKAMAAAMVEIIDANERRRQRFLDKRERIRAAVARAMADAGLKKVPAPDMTISVRAGKVAPKIVDAEALPEWARIEKRTWAPDRDAIKQAYEEDPAGFSCPGVIIPNAEPVLTVRDL
jgi:hypothetical protein